MICGSLFSGIGLLDYGLHLAGLEHAWFAERGEYRRGILAQRWPGALILDDVRAVRADAVPRVDVIAGGFPCKGISSAGKREGFGHPETVLWREMARAVRDLRPRYVLVENVDDLLSLHGGAIFGEVLGDLAALGFDVWWDVLPAAAVGAPHLRQRVLAVATHSDGAYAERDAGQRRVADGRPDARGGGQDAADPSRDAEGRAGTRGGIGRKWWSDQSREGWQTSVRSETGGHAGDGDSASARGVAVEWGEYEPAIRRWEQVHGPAPEPLVRGVDDRSAARVERSRLSALGDGVQVQVGYLAGLHILDLERERLVAAATV